MTAINSGDEPITFTLRGAAAQFGSPVETLRQRLLASGEEADSDSQTFTLRQIVSALYPDESGARLRRTQAEADLLELKSEILRAEYLSKPLLTEALSSIVVAISQIVDGTGLAPGEKTEIRQNLAAIPVVVEQQRKAQTRLNLQEEVATPAKRGKGRPRKVVPE